MSAEVAHDVMLPLPVVVHIFILYMLASLLLSDSLIHPLSNSVGLVCNNFIMTLPITSQSE